MLAETLIDLAPDAIFISDLNSRLIEINARACHLHKDGSCIPTEVSTKILPDGRWVTFVRDRRESNQTELALRTTEQQLRQLSDSIPQFVWI